jgi:hypothetical protein
MANDERMKKSSFVIRHSEILLPVILIRPAEDELNLLGAIVLRPQQDLDRGLNLGAPLVAGRRTIGSIDAIERGRHFQQFRSNRQELSIKYDARGSHVRHGLVAAEMDF